MARQKATPESRKESYGTKGRPLSDWEALRELWTRSATVREASNDAFTRFEKHAYAQPATQREVEGRELTELIWAEMRAAGYEVETDPVHFVRVANAAPTGAPVAGDGAPVRTPHAPPPAPQPPLQGLVAVLGIVALVVIVVLLRRRRRD